MRTWHRALSLMLGLFLVGVVGGCGSSSPPSPAEALRRAAELAHDAGSVRADGTAGWSEPAATTAFRATLSWSPGATAEFTMPADHTARFTSDAQYLTLTPTDSAMLDGKPWGKRLYHQMGGDPDPAVAPERWRTSLARAFPAPYAAMLSQAPDLRLVGEKQRGGVSASHYAGSVDPGKLTVATELGLTEQLVQQEREESAATGLIAQRLDMWLAPNGYPISVQSQRVDTGRGKYFMHLSVGAPEPEVYVPVIAGEPFVMLNYHDYGEPGPVTAPPGDQVHQLGSMPSAPENVVEAYLNALNAHDLDFARSMLSPAYAERVERMTDSPFRNVISIRNIHIGRPVPAIGSNPGVWSVSADFTLLQRVEASMPNGDTSWGYQLVRDPATGGWVIVGEGVG